MTNFLIRSAFMGPFFANPDNARAIGRPRYGQHVIVKFDLAEASDFYGGLDSCDLDIIDVGYWYYLVDDPTRTLRYEEPCWHMRQGGVIELPDRNSRRWSKCIDYGIAYGGTIERMTAA